MLGQGKVTGGELIDDGVLERDRFKGKGGGVIDWAGEEIGRAHV